MSIFVKPIEIGDHEGFTLENDIFKRKSLGERLMSFMSMGTDPSVIVLDGEWGSGKSTFIKQWCGLLRKNSFPVIYFDAFVNDYAEDIFSSLAAEIISFSKDSPSSQDFINKATAACKVLLPHFASRILESCLPINKEDISVVKGAYKVFEFPLLSDQVIRDKLISREKDTKSFIEFRQALSILAGDAVGSIKSESDDISKKECKPLVFVIDELDRCKPTYALELLETIKHFYYVKNVNFILVTNMRQLESTIKCTYGVSDGAKYLEKFYDFKFSLNNKNNEYRNPSNSVLWINKIFNDDGKAKYVYDLISRNYIELRTCERIISLFNIVKETNKRTDKELLVTQLAYYLCYLKIVDYHMYGELKNGNITFQEIEKSIHFLNDESYTPYLVEGCLSENCSERARKLTNQLAWEYNLESSKIIEYHCNMIDEFYICKSRTEEC